MITSKPASPAGSEGAATTDKGERTQNQTPNLDALIGIVGGPIDEHERVSAKSADSQIACLLYTSPSPRDRG